LGATENMAKLRFRSLAIATLPVPRNFEIRVVPLSINPEGARNFTGFLRVAAS
jgi:hypothetical protein